MRGHKRIRFPILQMRKLRLFEEIAHSQILKCVAELHRCTQICKFSLLVAGRLQFRGKIMTWYPLWGWWLDTGNNIVWGGCVCVCVCVCARVPLLDQDCPKALALCVAQAAPHCVWGHQGRVSGRHTISVVVWMREAPLCFREGSHGLEMPSNLEDGPGFSQPLWEQISPPLG